MKRSMKITVFLVVSAFVFGACKKNWNCDCQWTAETFSNNTLITSQSNTQHMPYSKQKKKDAEELCDLNRDNLKASLEATNEVNNPGNTKVSTTAQVNCDLTKSK